jgi:ribose transport system substrate-binding protein
VRVEFVNAEDDSRKQQAHVEGFVTKGVDLIIISPVASQELTGPVEKAIEAGIPVIVLDRAIIGDKYTCFIGGNNEKIGEAAGLWLAEKLGGRGRIVELKGLMTSVPGQHRNSGFRKALINYPDIDVVCDPDMKWLETNARKEMESALSRFEKIDAVYAHNDPGAHGAYVAAEQAERHEEMLFIGIDALPDLGVAYVKQGILDISFEYPTGGAEAIDVALKILKKQPFDKDIELESKFFTKENVEQGGQPLEDVFESAEKTP